MTDPQQPDGAQQPWPTMADRSNSLWPSMPGSMAPATAPKADPLAPAQRKTLAPQGMPHQAPPPGTPAPQPGAEPNPNANPTATPVDGEAPVDADPSMVERTDAKPADGLDAPVGKLPCPHCGQEVWTYDSFCEACGGELEPTSRPPADASVGNESPIEGTIATNAANRPADPDLYQPRSHTCDQCQGVVGPDGYCTQCGAKAQNQRDHWSESPAAWVGGCSDRGVRHYRNEDAMGVASGPDEGSRAILVVCDGVSSSTDSDVASLAGARRARDVLLEARPSGLGTPESLAGAMGQALVAAAEEANEAVIAHTDPKSENAASCTFAAAIVEGGRAYYGNVGDSRIYWIDDDPSKSLMLSLDDSVAQARIAMGVAREEAENGYQAHAITKWLGRDSEDVVPRTGVMDLASAGFVMVCSDGLWNYCTDAEELAKLVRAQMEASLAARSVTGLAESLCAWANAQGGKDNVTVVLARIGALPDLPPPPPPAPRADAAPTAPVPSAEAVDVDAPSEEPAPVPASQIAQELGVDPASLPTADEAPGAKAAETTEAPAPDAEPAPATAPAAEASAPAPDPADAPASNGSTAVGAPSKPEDRH